MPPELAIRAAVWGSCGWAMSLLAWRTWRRWPPGESPGGLIAATGLVGVSTLVAGIQPAIALELVHEGLDLGGARIVASMRDALRHAGARRRG